MNDNNLNQQGEPGVQNGEIPEIPKSYNAPNLSAAKRIGNKVYRGAKKAGNAMKKALKFMAKTAKKIGTFLITHPHIALALAIIIILFVLVVFIINQFKNLTVLSNIGDSSKSIVESWDENNLSEQQKAAKTSYEKSGSLIDFSTSDMAKMKADLVDKYQGLDKGKIEEKKIYKALLTTVGDNFVTGSDRVLSENDMVTLYEHIINISKYDFNNVKWKQYGHGHDGNDSPMKNDLALGVKYPSDQNSTKYETFSTLLRPYLLSYEIPTSLFAGLLSDEDDKSVETTYAFIKYGLSDITVNRYDIQKYTLRTYYRDYNYNRYRSKFNITFTPNNDGTYSISYGNVTNDFMGNGHVNTTEDENGVSSVMRETKIDDQSGATVTNKYYISKANIYDLKISAEYNYILYSEADVNNRTNEDSLDTTEEPYVVTEGTKIENVQRGASSCTALDIQSQANSIASLNGASVSGPTDGQNGAIVYTITSNGTYEDRDGTTFYCTRTWEDKLSQKERKEEFYEATDVAEYNKDCKAGNISEDDFNSDTPSVDYYKDLAEKKKLNRFDFINSNPNIYKLYVNTPYQKYVGIPRATLNNLVYNTLKENWSELKKKYKTFPYIYGKTLGFGSSSGARGDFLSGMNLLRMYINSFEGDGSYEGGGRFDENHQQTTDDAKAVYYKVYDARDGVHTVGYGVNMEANRGAFEEIGIDVSTVQYGDYIEKKIVDKIQENILQGRVDRIKAATTGIDLKEYQIHALVSHSYVCGNINGFNDAYTAYWNQETDDKYEELYEKYKETPEMSSTILSEVNYEHNLYKTWFYYYNGSHDGGGRYPGWVTRQKSEYALFQTGYYSTLKRFWGNSEGIPGGYVLVNGGEIDKAACLDLQVWYEQNLFSGKLQCDTDVTSGAAQETTDIRNTDSRGNLNPEYSSIFRSSYVYQCPWWSYVRGALYYQLVGREDLAEKLHGAGATGDGRDAASYASGYLGIKDKLNTSIDGIQPYSIISFDKVGSGHGHTAFVEAVTDDSIIVSDCGSGYQWYGVHIVSKSKLTNPSSDYYFTASICLADAL